MKHTRRNLGLLLLAASAAAQEKDKRLPSLELRYDDLPVKTTRANRNLKVLEGETHTGYPIEVHETELPPGEAPHPAHHHPHEEMVLIREGLMEVNINGKKAQLGPGSAAYVASNEEHGWHNAGTVTAKYFVIAFGPGKP